MCDELWMMINGLPTSVNRMNRQYSGRKVPVKSAEYIEFRDRVWNVLRKNGMPRCPWDEVSVRIWLFPPNNRKIDADNRFKALFDALNPNEKQGWPGFWTDDSIVRECSAIIGHPVEGGAVVVRITRLTPQMAAADWLSIPERLTRNMTPYKNKKKRKKS